MRKGIGRLALLALAALSLAALLPISAAAAYSDLPTTNWAYDKITEWSKKGYMEGYPDGTFKPNGNITRAEFVKIANRAFGFTAASSSNPFSDIGGHWAKNEILVARAKGYVNGYTDGTFRPEASISRQEAAKIICTILGLAEKPAAVYNLTDWQNIDAWAQGYVGAVYDARLMGAYTDKSFKGRQLLTRAECVDGLYNGVVHKTPTQDLVVTSSSYKPSATETVRSLTVRYAGAVDIQNLIVLGDVTIDSRVGDRTVTLKNVRVDGSIYVQDGSLVLDGTTAKALHLNSAKTGRSVTLKGASSVESAFTGRSATLDQTGLSTSAAGIQGLYVGDDISAQLVLRGAFRDITIARRDQSLLLAEGGSVANLYIAYRGTDVLLGQGATLAYVEFSEGASGSRVEGPGTVAHAYVDTTGITLQRTPTKRSGSRSPSISGEYKLGFMVTDIHSGTPVRGAKVVLMDGLATGTTSSSGYIEFRNMPDREIAYEITMTDYAALTGSVSINGNHRYPSVALTPVGIWRADLLVQDSGTKAALRGASATLSGTGARSTVSGSDGKIYFENLGKGTYTYSVSAPGYVTQTGKTFTVSSKDVSIGTASMVKTKTLIRLYSEYDKKTAITGFEVLDPSTGQYVAAKSGVVTLEGLEVGTRTVKLRLTGSDTDKYLITGKETVTVKDQASADSAVYLAPAARQATYTVQVYNRDGTATVPGAVLVLKSSAYTDTKTAGSDGIAYFKEVPQSQSYTLTVTAPGYEAYENTAVAVDDKNPARVVYLIGQRTVKITVVGPGDSPVVGAVVVLEAGGSIYRSAGTDAAGLASLAGIPEGSYAVSINHANLEVQETLVVGAGANTLTVTARPLSIAFSITLVPPQGKSLPASLTLKNRADGIETAPFAIKNGTAAVKVSTGDYDLVVEGFIPKAENQFIRVSKESAGSSLTIDLVEPAAPSGD